MHFLAHPSFHYIEIEKLFCLQAVGTHYAAKKHFTDETVEEKMPSRVKDGQSRKTVIQHHRKKRRSRPSKPRHGEQPKTKHRETAAVTELMRKAEDLKKVQCKVSLRGHGDKDCIM